MAKWWKEGLPPFNEFYVVPTREQQQEGEPPKPSLDDCIEMMHRIGEGGPPVLD